MFILGTNMTAVRSSGLLDMVEDFRRVLRTLKRPTHSWTASIRALDDWHEWNIPQKQATSSSLLSFHGRYGRSGDLQAALFPPHIYGKARNISAHWISDQTQTSSAVPHTGML